MSKEDIKSKNNSQQSENKPDETKITEAQKETEKVDPQKKIEELEKTIAELKDSILRLLASNENERKRHVKDLEEIRKYANKRLIQRILPFLDNYKQALELSEKMKDPKISNFLLGFEMILKEFWNIMESEKVEEIKVAPKKDLLNSDYHQVIEEVENNDFPSGTVLEVMQKGYLLDKQLLKPARVKVSKKLESEEKK